MEGVNIKRYSIAFKQSIVQQIESGIYSVADIIRLYEVSNASIHSWLNLYGKRINKIVHIQTLSEMDPLQKAFEEIKQLKDYSRDLESALAQAHLKILALSAEKQLAQEEGSFKKNENLSN